MWDDYHGRTVFLKTPVAPALARLDIPNSTFQSNLLIPTLFPTLTLLHLLNPSFHSSRQTPSSGTMRTRAMYEKHTERIGRRLRPLLTTAWTTRWSRSWSPCSCWQRMTRYVRDREKRKVEEEDISIIHVRQYITKDGVCLYKARCINSSHISLLSSPTHRSSRA